MLNKLHKLAAEGKITPYLYSSSKCCIDQLPKDMQEQMVNDVATMSAVGVNSSDDRKHFMYISMHIKDIANKIAQKLLSNDELASISSIVFSDRNIYTIDTIYNFYKATDRAMKIANIPIKKIAYPTGFGEIAPDNPHNISKWIVSMREIYERVHRGMTFEQAFDKVTNDWDIMEKQDFNVWQRYYQEGAHQKYKTAQTSYYNAADGSPLIPFKDLRSRMPGIPDSSNVFDIPPNVEEERRKRREEDQQKLDDRNNLIEDIKKKLISRLTSAEKLITDRAARDDLNNAIDIGLDKWLETLHALKRSIQTAPMSSAASPILQDIIIKKANQITNEGYIKTGNLLKVLAQETKAPPVDELSQLSEDDEFIPEALPEAAPEALPETAPEDNEDAAMDDFVRLINHEHFEDESDADDELIVEAQALLPPEESPVAMESALMEPAEDIEVSDNSGNDILEGGDALDAALVNISIEDVIKRLDLVSNIIQNREIPRQLSFVDMMLGKLGIATYFPSLGEAIRSALESHQYMYTRIEDIQSKLRGSVRPPQQIDLTTTKADEEATSDTMESVRRNLDESERSERARSEQRKAQREAKEVIPPAAIAPELAGPVEVETAPIPTRAT